MTISDADTTQLDTAVLLPGNFLGRHICMGYNLGVMIYLWPTVLVLQYAWPEESSYSAVSRNIITQKEMFTGNPSLLIDLSSGRVVISGDRHTKQYLLEPSNLL